MNGAQSFSSAIPADSEQDKSIREWIVRNAVVETRWQRFCRKLRDILNVIREK